MKFLNICTKKSYTKKDGTAVTTWLQVGTLRQLDDGKMFIELNLLPNETLFVFEPRKKEEPEPAPSQEAVEWDE